MIKCPLPPSPPPYHYHSQVLVNSIIVEQGYHRLVHTTSKTKLSVRLEPELACVCASGSDFISGIVLLVWGAISTMSSVTSGLITSHSSYSLLHFSGFLSLEFIVTSSCKSVSVPLQVLNSASPDSLNSSPTR